MTAALDTVLEIDTPEHLAFRARIAGPARRMLAWLIDGAVRAGIILVLVIGSSVLSVEGAGLSGVSSGFIFLGLFLIDWFYYFFAEMVTGGRSPGKLALKLRVVQPNGLPITWRESFLRNLVRAADITMFPPHFLLLGPMVMAFDPKFRRLGDLVANTIVVVEESERSTRRQPVAADPALVDELPGTLPLDRDDLEALELFVSREHMSDARREELAEIVAAEYATRLALPKPRNSTVFLASIWARAQDPRRKASR